MDKLGDLSDEELLARVRGHVGKGNVWCAELIAYLVEVDERWLDRVHACSSMWDFCTRKLGMSEGEAHRRIAAARAVRRFPEVLGYIERGELHLCALYALRKHLTNDNVDELLRAASGKSTREVEKMVAARFPRPDVPMCVEPVAPQALLSPVSMVSVATPTPASGATRPDSTPAWSLSLAASPAPGPRPRVEPLSSTRYRIELTVSATTKETIDHIKDLMRHRNPTGDLSTILDASLALLRAKLEKERLGKTTRPAGSRRKPAEATSACAAPTSASAHAESSTRAPTTPVRLESTANDPAAPSTSGTTTRAPTAPVRLESTANDPATPSTSEATTRAPHRLARAETVAVDSAAPRLEASKQEPGAHAHVHVAAANGDPSAPAPASADTGATAPASADTGATVRASADTGLSAPASADTGVPAPASADKGATLPAASTPPSKASRPRSRSVPAEVRREVFARDGERCTYVGPDGDRCPARGYLELDHVRPKAHKGMETPGNLRVRCRAHNALYAEQVFGRAHVESRMHLRRRKCAPTTPASFEIAARGLRSLGFREPEARRALETLATKRDMDAAPVETILREALLVLA